MGRLTVSSRPHDAGQRGIVVSGGERAAQRHRGGAEARRKAHRGGLGPRAVAGVGPAERSEAEGPNALNKMNAAGN